jgi:hypothetical protein
MQTRVEALTLFPRALKAANEEIESAVTAPSEKNERQRTSGWDPYEVWRTRIQAPQNSTRPTRNR